ncbi:MAG: cytochrome C biogenesis protein [Gammaproteobacteria bacterium]|nr:MAG: cytochrome C biogenesis protein [Gammaproteobacteria bacterium]
MPDTILAPLAALLYLTATGLQLLHMSQRRQQIDRGVFALSLAALLLHAIIVWNSIIQDGGVDLGFYKVSALIFLVINVACITSLARRPLQNLLVVLFPLSAMAVLVATFAPDTSAVVSDLGGGMLLHISSSILAYAVLSLAAFQSALLAVQDHQLKHRHTRGIIQILPPLQLMETMLFELLWIGVTLLTIAIASGFVFIDDIFAQSLVHKTVLTIIAWLLFSVLLWGHYQLGWRSRTAVHLTLAGFALLMLAFFGSKLVLELILQRG